MVSLYAGCVELTTAVDVIVVSKVEYRVLLTVPVSTVVRTDDTT